MDVPADKRDERGVLATLIPPAVSQRRSEWPNSDTRERRRADAPLKGDGGQATWTRGDERPFGTPCGKRSVSDILGLNQSDPFTGERSRKGSVALPAVFSRRETRGVRRTGRTALVGG